MAKKVTKKVATKKVVKKPVKKVVGKKESPLNSKSAIADLRKRYAALDKLNIERAAILEDIAKREAALGEVLDMNLAKFDDQGVACPPEESRSITSTYPGIAVNPCACRVDTFLHNAIAVRQ